MLRVYSVYDSKINAYMNPIFLRSKGEAIRVFSAAVSDANHDFSKYAEDFTLFELGSFDPNTAKFTLHSTPISLGVAIEFRKDAV